VKGACLRVLLSGAVLFSVPESLRAAQTPPTPKAHEHVLKRIAVVGASVSAGFGLEREAGRAVNLAQVLDAALKCDHERVWSGADALFFLDPRKSARWSIDKAKKRRPTLLFALDFLFWFGYGQAAREEDRLGRLEEGLKFLDELQCACLVGDLPDMSESIGRMLSSDQVPAKETLKRLNERIRKWASKRKRVVVVPLADLMEKIRAGKTVEIGSYKASGKKLLQPDRLHTTLEGTAAAVLLSLLELRKARKDVKETDFFSDPGEIAARIRGAGERKEEEERGLESIRGDRRIEEADGRTWFRRMER